MQKALRTKPIKINKLGYRILGVIARAPQSGYDVVKALVKFRPVNISQVYPIVTEMEGCGLLRSEEIRQSGKPDKKVYHLLEPGRLALEDWIAEPTEAPQPRDEFVAKVFSLWIARPEERVALIRERLELLAEEIAFFTASLGMLEQQHGDCSEDPETWQFCRHVLIERRLMLYHDEVKWCHDVLNRLEQAA